MDEEKNEDNEKEELKDAEEEASKAERKEIEKETWTPKTKLGLAAKERKSTDMSEILDKGLKIMEPEIVDILLPDLETDLLLIGQSKGKFGGGQRRVFRQTQKKTREGNKPSFSTMAVVGNKNGFVGMGIGKSKETVPARDKAIRNAKLNIIKIRRGSGAWESTGKESNSIPFMVTGKEGRCQITLMPAPKGVGLCVEKECAKMLRLAGISDIWSKTSGQTKTKVNLITACFNALKQLMKMKVPYEFTKNIYEGAIEEKNEQADES